MSEPARKRNYIQLKKYFKSIVSPSCEQLGFDFRRKISLFWPHRDENKSLHEAIKFEYERQFTERERKEYYTQEGFQHFMQFAEKLMRSQGVHL